MLNGAKSNEPTFTEEIKKLYWEIIYTDWVNYRFFALGNGSL